jgi:hypothetical protein
MTQLTLRGFDEELERRVRRLAARERISLNKAALKLMRQGAGLSNSAKVGKAIGTQLDDFIGSWDREQWRELEEATAVFERIDEEQWQ